MGKMHLGVDFDNTIVCYDQVFHIVALEQGLIPSDIPATKGNVRDYLRKVGREDAWTELQGYVYGARMAEASAFPGALDFFTRCMHQRIPVHIISHKTQYPYRGPQYDLHKASYEWLECQGFFDPVRIGLPPERVHFELTKADKLARISQVGCTCFIDDLPEFLEESGFPVGVERILFAPKSAEPVDCPFRFVSSWIEIEGMILDGMGKRA